MQALFTRFHLTSGSDGDVCRRFWQRMLFSPPRSNPSYLVTLLVCEDRVLTVRISARSTLSYNTKDTFSLRIFLVCQFELLNLRRVGELSRKGCSRVAIVNLRSSDQWAHHLETSRVSCLYDLPVLNSVEAKWLVIIR